MHHSGPIGSCRPSRPIAHLFVVLGLPFTDGRAGFEITCFFRGRLLAAIVPSSLSSPPNTPSSASILAPSARLSWHDAFGDDRHQELAKRWPHLFAGQGMPCRCHSVLRSALRRGLPHHDGRKLSDRCWALCVSSGRCTHELAHSLRVMVKPVKGESSLYPLFC